MWTLHHHYKSDTILSHTRKLWDIPHLFNCQGNSGRKIIHTKNQNRLPKEITASAPSQNSKEKHFVAHVNKEEGTGEREVSLKLSSQFFHAFFKGN